MTRTWDTPEAPDDATATCLLSEREQALRGDELGRDLFARVEEVAELPDGYAYRFPAEEAWTETLLGFVAAERRCCPFLTFELAFEPHGGPLWLRLRGSAEIKRFVRETFVPLTPTTR
jgi:hypothetical protein